MKQVIILGVGGYCANVIDIIHDINKKAGNEVYRVVGFIDDDAKKIGTIYAGLPVLGHLYGAGLRYSDVYFVNGIGSAQTAYRKREIIEKIGVTRDRFVTLVHPSAYVAPSVVIGAGCVVAQQCMLMAGAVIGDHVKMLPLATISYGSKIGDYSTVSSGAVTLSDVVCGLATYVGANVTIRERVQVGDYCVLGMGSVILHDVPANCVMVGNPARVLRPTIPV